MAQEEKEPQLPRVKESRYAFKGKLVRVRIDRIVSPEGRESEREVVEHPGAVLIVALDDADNVFLVHQYRHPVGRRLYELPAGTLDPEEDPRACAERELREETGFTAHSIERIGGFFLSPGYSNEYISVFLARQLEESPLDSGDEEDLSALRVPLADVARMVERGEIQDAKSIAALHLLSRRHPIP